MGKSTSESDQDILIVPEEYNFKSDLEEGASEVASNDKKFEMYFDFRDFTPKDVKITIKGTTICILAHSETEFEINEFDDEIKIPERVLRETISCKMNKKGVLRISAPLQPDCQEAVFKIIAEHVTTQKRTVEGAAASKTAKVTTESSEEEEVDEEDYEEEMKAAQLKSSQTTTVKTVKTTSTKKIDQNGNILITPNKENFVVDKKLVKDTPEFGKPEKQVGSISALLSAYMKCTQYSPAEISIKITKSIIRIEGRHESKLEKQSFYKEINIPNGVKREEIECSINDGGIVRITAPFTESASIATSQTDDAVVLTPKKINFECPPQEDIGAIKQVDFFNMNEKTVQVFANISQYSSGEVLIRKTRRMIQVEGRHESKSATREFYREIAIPGDVDGNTVDCAINNQGILRFTATRVKAATIIQPKIIQSSTTSRSITSTSSGQMITGTSGTMSMSGNFETSVVATGYSPEEINISIDNGWITVTGKKEARVFGGETSFRNRTFTKKIQVPPHINAESIVCSLDDNSGALVISAK